MPAFLQLNILHLVIGYGINILIFIMLVRVIASWFRIDERNARFRNFDVATGEFFNDSGKLWLVTAHHNGFAFDFPDHLPKPLKTEAVSELWLDLHSNRETLSDDFSRLRGPRERAG